MKKFATLGSLVALAMTPLFVQGQDPKPRPVDPPGAAGQVRSDLRVRGKITRIEGTDSFIVRGADNKDVTIYATPTTRYLVNGRASKFSDLRVGTEINATYVPVNERHTASLVTVGATEVEPAPGTRPIVRNTVLRGRIVRVQAPDQIVIRTAADKEVVLYSTPQTRYTIDGRAVQFSDFRVGAEINADYIDRDGRYTVSSVSVGDAAATDPPTTRESTRVEGTVLRLGENQVVIRTGQNKEVIIHVDPQTKYDADGRFTDVRTGSDVRIEYDVRDRRPVARIINRVKRDR